MPRSCNSNWWSAWIVSAMSLVFLTANVVAQSPAIRPTVPFGAPAQSPQQATQTQAPGPQPQADPALASISQGLATAAPAPLLQKPPVPPSVSFQNGLLSINAPNSNLSDVLSAVRRATGAVIEGGGGVGPERVVVHLGPGRPNDVLSTLLNGSRFNYVLLGAPQNPDAVTRIVLSLRQGGDQFPAAQAVAEIASNEAEDDSREERERENRRRASTDEAGQPNVPEPAQLAQPPSQPKAQEQPNPQEEQ